MADLPEDPTETAEAPNPAAVLMQEILAETRCVAAAEARKLKAIAALNSLDCMRPLPPAGGRKGRALEREDLTESELAAGLHISQYQAGRLLSAALGLTSPAGDAGGVGGR